VVLLFLIIVTVTADDSDATPLKGGAVASAAVSAPTFPYTPQEVRPWYNELHPQRQISGSQSFYLAAYMNAIVRYQIGQYLLAVYLSRVQAAIPNEARWDRVAACESGGNWSINTGNGYYGGLQFSLSTWRGVGGQGYPHQNSKAEQIRRAEQLRISSGLHHWPVCGSRW
jgi:resuscitation-promoting factor RpfE